MPTSQRGLAWRVQLEDSLNILRKPNAYTKGEDGDWWSQVHLCPELVRGVCLLSLNFAVSSHMMTLFSSWDIRQNHPFIGLSPSSVPPTPLSEACQLAS